MTRELYKSNQGQSGAPAFEITVKSAAGERFDSNFTEPQMHDFSHSTQPLAQPRGLTSIAPADQTNIPGKCPGKNTTWGSKTIPYQIGPALRRQQSFPGVAIRPGSSHLSRARAGEDCTLKSLTVSTLKEWHELDRPQQFAEQERERKRLEDRKSPPSAPKSINRRPRRWPGNLRGTSPAQSQLRINRKNGGINASYSGDLSQSKAPCGPFLFENARYVSTVLRSPTAYPPTGGAGSGLYRCP